MIISYRAFGACITWVALFGHAILLKAFLAPLIDYTTIDYLSNFHVLTNIFVGLAFAAPLLKPENKLRRFFEIQAVRAAIALYITVVMAFYTVTMVVFWDIMAPLHNLAGIHAAIFNVLQNLVIPLLYILDWLFFSPKDQMLFKRIPYWIIFPVTYGVYTFIRSSITGDYHPLPLNVIDHGIVAFFVYMLGVAALYAIGSAIFIALGRRLGSKTATAKVSD